MTVKDPSGTAITSHDPRGPIECTGCDKLGRPRRGVTWVRHGQRITQSFVLPEGWAFADCAVWCGSCANKITVQAMRGIAERLQRGGASLADAVFARALEGHATDEANFPREPPGGKGYRRPKEPK